MRKLILVVTLILAASVPSTASAASVTRDQAERVARWYTVGLDLSGDGTRSGIQVLGCRERTRSWLCQIEAPGESIVLDENGEPLRGTWRFALRVTGAGCRVVVVDDGERTTYRACPRAKENPAST